MNNLFEEENPFNDPSITIAIQDTTNHDDETALLATTSTIAQENSNIISSRSNSNNNSTQQNVDSSSRLNRLSSSQTINSTSYNTINPSATSDKMEAREKELRKREEELNRKEQELQKRQAEIQRERENISNPKANNFPPFYPIMYHDIEQEIPTTHQSLVKKIFHYYLATAALLLWNMIAAIVIFASSPDKLHYTVGTFSGGILNAILIPILAFFLWYRPAYNAFMKNSSLYYILYFFFGGCHILFAFYMAVGVDGSGAAGFINGLGCLTSSALAAGILALITAGLWIVDGLAGIWLWKRVRTVYEDAGHTLESAKNQVVNIGAQQAASSYIRSETGNFTNDNPQQQV